MTTEPEHNQQHLDRAFAGGIAWTAAAKWISQLVSWPSVLICARLLSPADFGIVEMAGFYFIITNVVAEFGIGTAVLQMRELDGPVIAQLNTVAMMGGLLAYGISILSAPLLARFFHTPALTVLVIVASFSFILTSLEAIPLGLLQRDMNYRKLSIAESVQAIVTAVVAVACAWSGMAYWSLIAGNLVGRAANIGLAIFWRPAPFGWPRWQQVAEPMKFGTEIAVQRIAGSVGNLSDSMVIGRTLGQSPLGVYRIASNLASTPSEKIGGLIMRATGPLFARVQNDRDLLRRYFLIVSESLTIAVFPLLFGLAIVAPEAVHFLGPQWDSAVSPLRWVAGYMALRTVIYLMNQLLTTLRFTRFGMWMSALSFVLMPVAFYVASPRGIGAVAAAWVVMSPITAGPVVFKALREIECSIPRYLKSLAPALLGSAAMLLAVASLQFWLASSHWPLIVRLTAEVVAGGAAYVGLVWGLYHVRIMLYVQFFRDLRGGSKAAAAVPE